MIAVVRRDECERASERWKGREKLRELLAAAQATSIMVSVRRGRKIRKKTRAGAELRNLADHTLKFLSFGSLLLLQSADFVNFANARRRRSQGS